MGRVVGFHVGWGAVRKNWEAQASVRLGGKVTASGMEVTTGRDLAVASSYEKGENTSGARQIVSIRATNSFRREEGQWQRIDHHMGPVPQRAR